MANKTQCPYCFTVYIITDEQYRKSKGKVRCGNCRQPFYANFLPDTEPGEDSLEPQTRPAHERQRDRAPKAESTTPSPAIQTTPPPATTERPTPQLREHPAATEQSKGLDESTQFHEETRSFFSEPLSEATIDEMSRESEVQIDPPSFPTFDDSFEHNLHSELTIEMDDLDDAFENYSQAETVSVYGEDPDPSQEYQQAELALPNIDDSSPDQAEEDSTPASETPDPAPPAEETTTTQAPEQPPVTSGTKPGRTQALIDEVDQLIDNHIITDEPSPAEDESGNVDETDAAPATTMAAVTDEIAAETTNESTTEDSDEPFTLDQRSRASKILRWVFVPVLLVLVLVLLAGLGYQLWLRQALPVLENEQLTDAVAPVIQPWTERLEDEYEIKIPVRRDLANLHLVSARTEPHPTRSSTVLLKVKLVNQSTIAQPFPWMELVLTDEDGRLVSRRSLRPDDYLHNNRLQNRIKPNELRQVTIELLSFPKQAHGYELKLINR